MYAVQAAVDPDADVAATAVSQLNACKADCVAAGLADALFVADAMVDLNFQGAGRRRADGSRKPGGRRRLRPSEHALQLVRSAYDETLACLRYERQQALIRSRKDAGRVLTYDHCYKCATPQQQAVRPVRQLTDRGSVPVGFSHWRGA